MHCGCWTFDLKGCCWIYYRNHPVCNIPSSQEIRNDRMAVIMIYRLKPCCVHVYVCVCTYTFYCICVTDSQWRWCQMNTWLQTRRSSPRHSTSTFEMLPGRQEINQWSNRKTQHPPGLKPSQWQWPSPAFKPSHAIDLPTLFAQLLSCDHQDGHMTLAACYRVRWWYRKWRGPAIRLW